MLDRGGKQFFLTDRIVIAVKDTDKELLKIFRRMNRIFYARPSGWALTLKAGFYTFLAKLIEEASPNWVKKHTTAQVAGEGIAWLEFEYMKNTPLDDLAKKCGVSKSTFRRNFIKITGMSPIAYRNDIRLKRAYEFLKTGIYTVAEVASMVGFNDVPYFSKAFKKKFEITPSECIDLGGKDKSRK